MNTQAPGICHGTSLVEITAFERSINSQKLLEKHHWNHLILAWVQHSVAMRWGWTPSSHMGNCMTTTNTLCARVFPKASRSARQNNTFSCWHRFGNLYSVFPFIFLQQHFAEDLQVLTFHFPKNAEICWPFQTSPPNHGGSYVHLWH